MLLAVHYRVMEHLGSLESTQEARVAPGYRLGQLLKDHTQPVCFARLCDCYYPGIRSHTSHVDLSYTRA